MRPIRIALLLCAAAALPAPALLIRADREDAEYLEMATKYTSSVAIGIPGSGEGVLISPRWVLTSAQVGSALREMKSMPALTFDGRGYDIEDVLVYPTWRRGTPSSDLALVYLRKAVRGVKPTPPYKADDEGGKAVVIVGHGASDAKARGAINTVDSVAPKVLTLLVKKADEASDLQGSLSPGTAADPRTSSRRTTSLSRASPSAPMRRTQARSSTRASRPSCHGSSRRFSGPRSRSCASSSTRRGAER